MKWIYEQYGEKILNQSYRILLSKEQAEDVLQDIFIRLPVSIKEFNQECALGTWLFRITHNLCLSRLHQAKNRLKLEIENIDAAPFHTGESTFETSDVLNKALSALDEETRSLLWLKEGEGVPLRELSLMFKIPEGTLKSRLFRAREKMRDILNEEAKRATA